MPANFVRFDTPTLGIRQRLTHAPVYYGWIVVAACFVVGMILWGTVWSFGVFFTHILDEFGLSHANTSVVFSLQQVVTYVSAAIVGFVIDRYGIRRLLGLGAGLVVVGLFGVTQLTSFAGLLVSYGVVAASGFGILFVISNTTPTRWFERRRGFATGVATAGAGFGILAVPPIAETLIAAVGWRGAYAGLLLAFLGIVVVAVLVIADRPVDLDVDPTAEFPDGVPERSPSDDGLRAEIGRMKAVAKSPAFAVTFAAFVCFTMPVGILNVNLVEYTTNAGIGRQVGVLAISVIGGLNVAGKFVGGAVSDRLGRPPTIATSGVFMAAGIAILLVVETRIAVLVAAAVFGFGWGIWIALLAPLLADLFGTLSINALFGVTTVAFAVSFSVGPYLAGRGFDAFGSYGPALAVAAAIGVAGGGLVLLASRLASAR